MRLGQATLSVTPRRHSFDERILALNDASFEVGTTAENETWIDVTTKLRSSEPLMIAVLFD